MKKIQLRTFLIQMNIGGSWIDLTWHAKADEAVLEASRLIDNGEFEKGEIRVIERVELLLRDTITSVTLKT